uniref:Uncharacterized protein n=1 Tax=Rhizophora mucronata TaxID=61149 RepID=A0A2P2Q7A8_RHIMU
MMKLLQNACRLLFKVNGFREEKVSSIQLH